MKLTSYAVQKINYPSYFHISCLYILPVDGACGDEHFELLFRQEQHFKSCAIAVLRSSVEYLIITVNV